MNRALFAEKTTEFLTYLVVERNLSRHTVRAYEGDLQHLLTYWQQFEEQTQQSCLPQLVKQFCHLILVKYALINVRD